MFRRVQTIAPRKQDPPVSKHTYRERERRERARMRARASLQSPSSKNVSRRALVAHETERIKRNENPARKSHIGRGRRVGKAKHLYAPEHDAE